MRDFAVGPVRWGDGLEQGLRLMAGDIGQEGGEPGAELGRTQPPDAQCLDQGGREGGGSAVGDKGKNVVHIARTMAMTGSGGK